jgi:hypothetical protein|tara:strand:- start:3984 stop:4418 length:435 start_codon:yes stop_codon:yes gene_type:complete
MKNKSKEAINFLMTYGWVIMVFLIALATLDYFSIIDITRIFPEKCILSHKITCIDYEAKASEIKLVINNGIKSSIIVDSINVAGCSGEFSTPMSSDETSTFVITGCDNGKKNDLIKGEITLKYTEKRTGLQRTIYGKIKTKVLE